MEVMFSFDTTGSMSGCIAEVKTRVEETIRRLFADIPGLRIAVMAHGDYCDASNYVTKYVDFTNDVNGLTNFVQKVRTQGAKSLLCWAKSRSVFPILRPQNKLFDQFRAKGK